MSLISKSDSVPGESGGLEDTNTSLGGESTHTHIHTQKRRSFQLWGSINGYSLRFLRLRRDPTHCVWRRTPDCIACIHETEENIGSRQVVTVRRDIGFLMKWPSKGSKRYWDRLVYKKSKLDLLGRTHKTLECSVTITWKKWTRWVALKTGPKGLGLWVLPYQVTTPTYR